MQVVLENGRAVHIDVQKKYVKNITMRVYPDGNVKISAPSGMPDAVVRQFAEAKKRWLEKHLFGQTHAAEGGRPAHLLRLLGQDYPFHVVHADKNSVEIQDGRILIYTREPEHYARVLERWWKQTALDYYTLYVDQWLAVLGQEQLERPRISVRKMKTMWGSCTHGKAEIRYNYYLMVAPPQCVEYVVLHELAHLLYPNHGQRFKAFLTKYMPDWKERQQRMRGETRYIGF